MADPHAPQHAAPAKKSPTTLVSNILAIAGFVVLAIIVIWGLIHLASLSSGWFGNLFDGNGRGTITVSAPESAASGRPTLISWQHANEGGRYAFLYECVSGLDFGIPIVKEGETAPTLARVPCGTAFTLGNATSSLIVVPVLASSTPIVAHINIVYMPQGREAQASGNATMTVTPQSGTPAPTGETPTPTTRPTGGAADLAVTIVSFSSDGSGMTTAVFNIANIGGAASGAYTFSATLPTAQPYAFHSDPQSPLGPGDSIVNTLRFTQTVPGVFSVVVDPGNVVAESNESNNAASQQTYR